MAIKWNDEADNTVKTMYREGVTRSGIANALNLKYNTSEYTYAAVSHRIEALKLDKPGQDEKSEITYIPVADIMPHPDNPRKDYGDLTELTSDIKANGIMQNLVIVPSENGYYALVGNRRLEASKRAGFDKVPCAIAFGLSNKDQIARMLAENMQRKDLTAMEQLEGIQMMLDLGDTVDGIAKKTSLSKSTILRRIQLTKYDPQKLSEAFDRGAVLSDFDELKKIKNPEKQNELLEFIGTPNFRFNLQNAVAKEILDERKKNIVNKIRAFAEDIKTQVSYKPMSMYRYISLYDENIKIDVPDDINERKYYYDIKSTCIYMYSKVIENPKTDEEIAREKKEIARKEHLDELTEINRQMEKLRIDFVRNYSPGTMSNAVKNNLIGGIIQILFKASILETIKVDFEEEILNSCLDFNQETIEEIEDDDIYFELVSDEITKYSPVKSLLIYAVSSIEKTYDNKYYNRRGDYCGNTQTDIVYELLCLCGYEMSDEEKAMQNGTHKLFLWESEWK